MNRARKDPNRRRTYFLSRTIICIVVAGSLGSLFWAPPNLVLYSLDILLRTYLVFLGTVMAHEGVHGHLGPTKSANLWWGRIALIPSMVPFTNFRKTHHLHHRHTNEPGMDPDYFMRPRHPIEIPFRALAMPHQWLFWLKRRGLVDRRHLRELLLNYLALILVFGIIALVRSSSRLPPAAGVASGLGAISGRTCGFPNLLQKFLHVPAESRR